MDLLQLCSTRTDVILAHVTDVCQRQLLPIAKTSYLNTTITFLSDRSPYAFPSQNHVRFIVGTYSAFGLIPEASKSA